MIYQEPLHVEKPSASTFFYHWMDLPEFGVQEGAWDLRGRFANYTGHTDMRGKRVLDIGAASGFLSFSAEEAGASEVVSFDIDTAAHQHLLPFAGSEYVVDHASWVKKDRWISSMEKCLLAESSPIRVESQGDLRKYL